MNAPFPVVAGVLLVAIAAAASIAAWSLITAPLREGSSGIAVERCLPGAQQLVVYNNGMLALPSERVVLYDETIGPLNTSLNIPDLAPGQRVTISASPLYVGYIYYLEYPRAPLAKFIC